MDADEEKKEPKIHETFVFKVLFIAVVIVGLYFVLSPYQNCKREGYRAVFCVNNTSW